jgi:hypothetical protein
LMKDIENSIQRSIGQHIELCGATLQE